MVRSEIVHTLDSSFHMLRHFVEMTPVLAEQLLGKGYTPTDLEESLQTPGSRFDAGFASSIDQLLDRLFTASTYEVHMGMNGNQNVHARVHAEQFVNGIGTAGIMAKAALSDAERSRLYLKKNRDALLWHLDVSELPRTGEFTLILKPATDHRIFITAFPGPPALPIPDHRMSKDLYDACRSFWDEYVFLHLD